MRIGLGLGLPFALSKLWSVLSQFIGGATGLVLDPSNNATLFQDAAGITAVTAMGQPAGLLLDTRLGKGPELITKAEDRGFSSDTGFWLKGTTSIAGGVGVFNAAPDTAAIYALNLLAAGKYYEITFTIVTISSGAVCVYANGAAVFPETAPGTYTKRVTATTSTSIGLMCQGVTTATVDNMSICESLGNPISQATAGARPLVGARVNTLTKTEDFTDAAWTKSGVASLLSGYPDPLKGSTAWRAVLAGNANGLYQQQLYTVSAGMQLTVSVWARAETETDIIIGFNGASNAANNSSALMLIGPSWKRLIFTITASTDSGFYAFIASTAIIGNVIGGRTVDIWHPQVTPTAMDILYQRVNTAADYDSIGFNRYLTFDGVDDGMATGPITLSANMDYFIAVRRVNNGQLLLASVTSSGNLFFAVVTAGTGLAADFNAGTPTYAVDGVNLNGGAVGTTRGQLDVALTPNVWHVVEVRNLDLSAWTALTIGNYGGFQLNGDIGGIILCPAGDATQRSRNRKYLGAKVGLTLP